MKQHPFVERTSTNIFPSQNIPLSKKQKDAWKHANMDAGEATARTQYFEKEYIIDNYRLANDELIKKDYGQDDESNENFDLLNKLTQDAGVPDIIKNYGIISQPIATLEGELDALPDNFIVKGYGDLFENEKVRVKTELLRDWFTEYMNAAVAAKLESDDNPLFEDEEQYQQAAQQEMKSMFPPEIEKYMKSDYRHILEIWGQLEMKDQFERFKLKSLRRKEFADWLRAAQRFRHLYVGPKGLMVERLNPRFVFSSKSPNIEYVQDGDYAGFTEVLSIPATIDRYGYLMTEKQLNSLEDPYEERDSDAENAPRFPDGKRINYLSPKGVPYATRVLSDDPNFNALFETGVHPGMISVSPEELSKIDGSGRGLYLGNHIFITTLYWRSQQRIGKLTWENPQTGEKEILLVDETYSIPSYIKQIKNEIFDTDAGMNTLIWTRKTEIWQGKKLTGANIEPIYLDIKPCDLQINKLPILGHFANNVNTKPTSLVDKIKPWQWFFNVLMNQCYLYIQTEILPFALFSSNMIPTDKDYGGAQGLMTWLGVAQAIGANVADTSAGSNGENAGAQYPKIVDLDRGTRIVSRLNLAMQIKQLALEHIGISPQRMGAIKASETASGVAQATSASYTQTSPWFTGFFEGEKEFMQIQLDAAKYLQARGKQVDTINKSELSVEALNMALEDGDLWDLHLYVTDSQEELRNLQLAKQLALENNTSEMQMSDRLKLSTGKSLEEVILGLQQSEQAAIERRNQEMQLEQQKLEQQGLDAQAAREQVERHFQMELEKDLQVAYITAMGRQQDIDADDNGMADVIEFNKLQNQAIGIKNQSDFNNSKIQLDREKLQADTQLQNRKQRDDREARMHEFALEKEKLKRTKIAGDKSK